MTKILNALNRESSIIENSKGGLYFATSWNANLDIMMEVLAPYLEISSDIVTAQGQ